MTIEKIAVNGHYVWVDKDAEIKDGDYYYNSLDKEIRINNTINHPYHNKIIAASPELNIEGVPTYVEWLAGEKFPRDYRPIGRKFNGDFYDIDVNYEERRGFIKGYQAAEKEKSDELLTKYQEGMAKGLELCKELYTEDDVRKAIKMTFIGCQKGSYHNPNLKEEIIVGVFRK